MTYIQPVNRQQFTLMNKLDDLISPDNPVRLLDAIIEKIIFENQGQFNISGKMERKEKGRPAYHPKEMLKLYLYGYMNKIQSSRKLEDACHKNIEVKWLLGELKPDFKTIADYRKDHKEEIAFVTKKFRQFLKDQKYITGEILGVDGSKIKANASREMLSMEKIEKQLSRLDKNIEEYLSRIAENDVLEEMYDELEDHSEKQDINKHLLQKIIGLQEEVEHLQALKEQLENGNRKYISAADSDANLMKSRDGKMAAYNVQIVVDAENKMIAAADVFTEANDTGLLQPMYSLVQQELEVVAEKILADAGYENQQAIEQIEEQTKSACYVPFKKNKDDKNKIKFHYNQEKDEYSCSEDGRLVLKAKNIKKKRLVFDVYQGIDCAGCRRRSACTKAKNGRILYRNHNSEWRERYLKKLTSRYGKDMVKLRRSLVEHVFGTLKNWMGKVPLLLRGKDKVKTEINLYVTAYNLKRLFSMSTIDELLGKVNDYQWVNA